MFVYKRKFLENSMGGSKNKSPAQKKNRKMEKNPVQRKKEGDKSEGGSPKADITVMLTEEQASKAFKGAKVITVQERKTNWCKNFCSKYISKKCCKKWYR